MKLRTMNKRAPMLLLAAMCTLNVGTAQAHNGCPAGTTGCTIDNAHDRVRQIARDGARDMFCSPSTYRSSNGLAASRVRRGAEIIRDCVQCGLDAVQDGMPRFTPRSSSGGVR